MHEEFTPFFSKSFQMWDHFFSLFFGFQISKNVGHPTFGIGGKKTFKRYLKSEHTHRHTYEQIDL